MSGSYSEVLERVTVAMQYTCTYVDIICNNTEKENFKICKKHSGKASGIYRPNYLPNRHCTAVLIIVDP